MKANTETERIANETFNRAIFGGTRFYVNGVEWKPPISAERRGFWACLPRKQMGFAFPINWPNVVAFGFLIGGSVGVVALLVYGIVRSL